MRPVTLLTCAATLLVGVALLAPRHVRAASAGVPAGETDRTPLAVIVNSANPVASVALKELRSIFLGRRTTWEHGRRITVVLREPGHPVRQAALQLIYGMSEPELTRHLLHQAFNGDTAGGPRMLSSAVGVRRFVVNVPGAIGLVSTLDVDSTVKTLKVDGLSPTDLGYPLFVARRD